MKKCDAIIKEIFLEAKKGFENNRAQQALDKLEKSMKNISKIRSVVFEEEDEKWLKEFTNGVMAVVKDLKVLS